MATAKVLLQRSQDGVKSLIPVLLDLKACSRTRNLERGQELHAQAVKCGHVSDLYVASALINMYAKCGSMTGARQVFDSMKNPNVVAWSTLILGYADNGESLAALDLFGRMQVEGPAPNSITLVAAIKACTSLAVKGSVAECRNRGKEIHNLVMKNRCDLNIFVQTSLIDMYAKCENMVDARQVFDSTKEPDVVCWSVLILGYADNGQGFSALDLFRRMRTGGPAPNSVTLVAAIKACTSLAEQGEGSAACRDWGKRVHNLVTENECDSNIYIQSALIDMYSKCNCMAEARQVFNGLKHPDVVSWNALITGYADNGQGLMALDVYSTMKGKGTVPDCVTFAAGIKICALVGGLEFGRKIHSEISDFDVVLVTCLVDFYAKCGSLVEAQRVFDRHPDKRNIITWTALLAGFSNCGDHESVFRLFEGIHDAGFQPNAITFVSILSCCSHTGLLEKGKECFDAISTKYGIIHTVEHYTCMVDIFGRAKKLDDAMALLQIMHCSPNYVTWTTIMGICRKFKNVEMGRLSFQSLINLNGKDSPAYVLMGQIYGSRGMLQEQALVMGMRKMLSDKDGY